MRLRTTFSDYYDLAFDHGYGVRGRVFERIGGHTGPPKREQFRILEAAGFKTPMHGLVKDVAGAWWPEERARVQWVVAYEDEMAHCAEGKRFLTPGHYKWDGCVTRLPEVYRVNELYCSAFVGPPGIGLSWRRLQIGPHAFWIEYRSKTSWMSNMDGECEVVGVEKHAGFHPHIRRPLFAVDFVIGRELYAVDLNYGPGVRGSGVEDLLPAQEAVAAITSWFDAFGGVDEEAEAVA